MVISGVNAVHENGPPASSATQTNGINHHGINGNYVNGAGEIDAEGPKSNIDSQLRGVSSNGHNSLDGTHPCVELSEPNAEPIAIVGMAARLPGGVRDPQSFWESLITKKDARIRVPGDRYNVDAFHSEYRKPESTAADSGFFLENHDLQDFDSGFFNLSKKELDRLDPQQRLLLEVTWECLENAGQKDWRGKNVGCYIGCFGEDWLDMQTRDTQDMGLYRITGHNDFIISNRVSYEFDFKGPSMTIRTACSSSLICLHTACEALKRGDCDAALVGGSNLIISPTMTIAMTEQGVMSPTGSCKSFDAGADGYARGEAINAVYLKRLKDAVRDGDPIRAVIRGTATNSDGKTPGISYPNSEAHEAVIRRAYKVAGIDDFSQTAMVECHGTGTTVGDPLETSAVAKVFGKDGVFIGSVKPNMGHSEGASGLTSTIKMVLAMEKKTIPPNMRFNIPNPRIPFIEAKLTVPVESIAWPSSRLERVSVNSFGIGGANAHVVLESATARRREPQAALPVHNYNHPELLVFSANHAESLKKVMQNYNHFLDKSDVSIHDLAYTLSQRRNHMTHRSFCIADNQTPMEFSTPVRSSSVSPLMVFVFTGQGAQWAEMGRELFDIYPTYRKDIRAMDQILANCADPPFWNIEDELLKPQNLSNLDDAEFSQPLCTALQVGLVKILRLWGVKPHCVVGHSSGEIAAAFACGSIAEDEAILIAYHRGLVTKRQSRAGGMAAIGLGRNEILPYLVSGVVIACENSPDSVTLSGDADELDKVMASLKADKPDVLNRKLRVAKAYHSHHMAEVGEEYQSMLQDKVASRKAIVPLISSVKGKPLMNAGDFDAAYWRANLESPVLFYSAVNSILNPTLQRCIFLEIGPHSALAGPLRQIFKTSTVNSTYIPTLERNKDAARSLLSAVGQLHCQGFQIDFSSVQASRTVLTDLPPYPWHYENKFWSESRLSKEHRLREHNHHDLLGSRICTASGFQPAWRNILRVENIPWIQDHQIQSDVIFPGAGYIAMVGAAAQQLEPSKDFTVRDVTISAAMVFQEGKDVETVVSLAPHHLTVALDSAWYDFTISSYNGVTWTKHCTGQVRSSTDTAVPTYAEPSDLPREVSSKRWYHTMANVGLNYGPAFNGLTDISAGVAEHTAVASVADHVKVEESDYALHPTTLDLCFQLFSVALAKGQSRRFNQLCIPTYIKELYVRNRPSMLKMSVETASGNKGVVIGDAHGVSNGETFLRLQGLRLSPVEGNTSEDPDPHAAVQLVWKPDIDFLQDKDLMKVFKSVRPSHMLSEKLAVLCILETGSQLSNFKPDQKHFERFLEWVKDQEKRIAAGAYPLVDNVKSLAHMSRQDRLVLIDQVYQEALSTDAAAVATALMCVMQNLQACMEGKKDALELLLKDDVLTRIYGFAGLWEYKDFFNLLTHSKPHLRILEIGAGTGATTAAMLRNLTSEYGERLYSSYTYTDISAGFFISAKDRFSHATSFVYQVLDVTQDPLEQGFEANSYDLILASNVIHATPSIKESLRNIKKLLHPDGRLFLQELCPETKWVNYIMGVFSGWWLGDDDNRSGQPFISPERWNMELSETGYTGAQTVLYDDEPPNQINANILARPAHSIQLEKKVTLVYENHIDTAVVDLKSSLERRDYDVDICAFPNHPTADQDVIALLDLERPFFTDISSDRLEQFLKYIVNLQNEKIGVLWVTKASQVSCKDPAYSPIIGMSRTIRSELGSAFATMELDEVGKSAWEPICDVFSKFRLRSKEDEVDSDSEFALVNGTIYIPRFHWISVKKELSQEADLIVPKRLEIEKKGLLQTLQWLQYSKQPLASDEVVVETRASGLNFKDILIAMGIVEGQRADSSGLGCECSGVVCETGSDVNSLAVGDRVIVFTTGTLSTRVTTKATVCAKMPDSLSFEDGATMPCVYGTVVHSLINEGRLEKDMTVLIHSACGGVGIAAIQIAQHVGATIYVTVGTEEKAQYLMGTFGIPRHRIFNSRDGSFLPDVMRETGRVGIDLVLNSLSGELLHTSWKCVAEYGKMLELGKRDFLGRGKLTMDLFEANRSFHGIDLARISIERPEMTQRLLQQFLHLYEKGGIQPIRPIKIFDAEHIEDAFRYMQKGAHMGKIVIRMPADPQQLPAVSTPQKLLLRSDASYLMVGGLGGLGQAVSTWMAENGAKNLIYLSRSAGTTARDQAFVKELSEGYGCSVQMFAGSVSTLGDVENVVKNASKPIAGVMQMSMVLRDRALAQISIDDWNTVLAPKVDGTWNLHKAIKDLDFFVLFSSFSGLVGQWGQANYAASNTFLDAFAQYRHGLGLPASVLDIGAVVDVGYVSENKVVLENFMASHVHGLRENDLLDSLQLMIGRSVVPVAPAPFTFTNPGQVGIGLRSTLPISAPQNRNIWKRDPRMSLYRNLEDVSDTAVATTNDALRQFLTSAKSDPACLLEKANIQYLAHEIGLRLFSFLMRPEEELDLQMAPASVGLDSLIAIEMRNWWRQSLGFDVTVLEILAAGSIEQLGELAATRLREKFEINAGEKNR